MAGQWWPQAAFGTMRACEKLIASFLGVLVLIGVLGCTSHESRLYEGTAVDEEGVPIKNVAITLCYLGWSWDWSMAGGFPLTMGHSFCSEPVLTDHLGRYRVIFAGPPSTVIFARHPDWIQTEDYLAQDGRVVLVRRTVAQERRKQQQEAKERAFRKLKAGESAIEYYCRVVQKRSSVVELDYHGERIKVVQGLLVDEGRVLFALLGSRAAAKSFANDLIIREMSSYGTGRAFDGFSLLPQSRTCGNDMYYIQADTLASGAALEGAGSARIEVPSLRAIFATKIWTLKPEAAKHAS